MNRFLDLHERRAELLRDLIRERRLRTESNERSAALRVELADVDEQLDKERPCVEATT